PWPCRHYYLVHPPSLYNPLQPAPQRSFALSNMEALLRYGDTNSPALTTELFRLCPLNFGGAGDPDTARRRRLVTVQSWDVDRPGAIPFFLGLRYARLPEGEQHPRGGTIPFLIPGRVPFALLDSGDFGPGWRMLNALSLLPRLKPLDFMRRLDLNRYLPDYPRPEPDDITGTITDVEGFQV